MIWMTRFLDAEGDPSATAIVEPPVTPVPAPPAPATPPPTPPVEEDRRTPVQRAIEEARASIKSEEIVFDADAPTPGEQPRDELGRFASPDAPSGEEPAVPPAGPVAGEAAEGGAAVAEGEGQGADNVEADDPLLTVELPARRGQEPTAITVPDREAAEQLRHLKNGFMRGEEIRSQKAAIDQQKAELDYVQNLAEVDPVGFVIDHLDPAKHVDVAKHLLASPGVFEAILDQIAAWQDNPDARRADSAELQRDRIAAAQTHRTELEARRTQAAIVQDLTSNIEKLSTLVPQDLADYFRDDALGDVSQYIRTNRHRGAIPAELFPRILERRLKLYAIDPAKAMSALHGHPDSPDTPPAPRPKGPAAEALAKTAQGAKADGQKLVKAAVARKAVASSVPGAGAGVSTPRVTPPPKQGVKERVAWAKEHMRELFTARPQ